MNPACAISNCNLRSDDLDKQSRKYKLSSSEAEFSIYLAITKSIFVIVDNAYIYKFDIFSKKIIGQTTILQLSGIKSLGMKIQSGVNDT